MIAPSQDTTKWARRIFSDIPIAATPHPQYGIVFPGKVRDGDSNQIVVLGAIGRHKGSRRLLDLAQQARLTHPALRFHVLGYTDIDLELLAVGNVLITGLYKAEQLAQLVAQTRRNVSTTMRQPVVEIRLGL